MAVQVTENSAENTVVANISAVGGTAPFTFTITAQERANWFKIVGDELQVGSGTIDYETDTSPTVTIQVEDDHGYTFSKTFAIPVVNVTTDDDVAADAFTFTDVTDATLSTVYTSNTITVAGLGSTASVAVTITGGTYSKNGGGYTSAAGTAVNGDTFAVRVTSSSSNSTAVSATLTIGGVSDTYTVTTVAAATSPTVVQAKSHAIEGAPISTVTLNSAPTNGNLLIAFFAHWNNNPTAGSGWTQVEMTNGISRDGSAIYSKVAGAGESAAQTPTSGSALGGTLTIFEIAGAHATWEDAHFALRDIAASPTYSRTETTAGANELIIGVIENNANSTQPTGITGVDGTDGAFSATGRAVTGFHKAAATATTYPIVSTYAANQTCVYMSVCIKPA